MRNFLAFILPCSVARLLLLLWWNHKGSLFKTESHLSYRNAERWGRSWSANRIPSLQIWTAQPTRNLLAGMISQRIFDTDSDKGHVCPAILLCLQLIDLKQPKTFHPSLAFGKFWRKHKALKLESNWSIKIYRRCLAEQAMSLQWFLCFISGVTFFFSDDAGTFGRSSW